MGLDPRGFMDGAFRGFQMMESYYDRQDRKQDRIDSLRRADEANTENQRRYDAQIARQDERQVIEDQRYTENRTREDKNQAEERAWRKKVHEDNQKLQGLRYPKGGEKTNSDGFGKEYRGAVTKLMTWKRDAISDIDPYLEGPERDAAINVIEKQYKAGMTDINLLYSQTGSQTKDTRPTTKMEPQAPYLSWANNKDKANFVNSLLDKGQDLSTVTPEMLDNAFQSIIEKKKTSKVNADAESLRQKFYQAQ